METNGPIGLWKCWLNERRMEMDGWKPIWVHGNIAGKGGGRMNGNVDKTLGEGRGGWQGNKLGQTADKATFGHLATT